MGHTLLFQVPLQDVWPLPGLHYAGTGEKPRGAAYDCRAVGTPVDSGVDSNSRVGPTQCSKEVAYFEV